MPEIIQQESLSRESLFELFENKTFMDYFPLFYEGKKTIAQALRELGIKGRGSINNQLKIFRRDEGYDSRYILTEPSWKPPQKKILFTHRIVTDFLAFHAKETGKEFDISDQEIELLLEFMNLPGIDLVLRKNNRDLYSVLTKLSVSTIFFIVYKEKVGKKAIFVRDLENFVETFNVFGEFTREEREAYFHDMQEFNQKAGGQIYQTATKILKLNVPISLGSLDVYLMARGSAEATKPGVEALIRTCIMLSPDLERRLKMKVNRPEIVATFSKYGIDLAELLR